MTVVKTGPLTSDELIALWKSVTDESYNRPILDDPTSLALIQQLAEQLARTSLSIDRNTQAMFIREWSGQTAPPGSGETIATVELTFERTLLLDRPLTLFAGMEILAVLDDYSPEGPIEVSTGRIYIVQQDVTLAPGERGPILVQAAAEKAGPGYNNPPPGTIKSLVQAGTGLSNDGADVLPGLSNAHELRASVLPDVPVVENVGAYIQLTAGANAGQIRRVVGFLNPIPDVSGGSASLSADGTFQVSAVVGDFVQGEGVEQAVSGALGTILTVSNGYAVIVRNSGTFVAGQPITGETSNATALIDTVEIDPGMAAETDTAAWRVLSFVDDWGLTVSNADFPGGGLCGFLDELGNERGITRSDNESDEDYRPRVAIPADVVSPNAVIRAGNRILKDLCLEVCLREVGRNNFPGIFFDDDYSIPNFYDLFLNEMTWSGGGSGFLPGEAVFQIGADGVITRGTMMMDIPTNGPNSPLLPSVAVGVERIQGPGFVIGLDMVGETSGNVDQVTSVLDGFNPQYVWVVMLDLREFRGFFVVGIPDLSIADIDGFSYDQAPANAYDATDIQSNFYDADASDVNAIFQQIEDAIDDTRAAGVPFLLYFEVDGCVSP